MLTTNHTQSPAFLDILHDNSICIGQAVCEESGFWVFYPNDKPGYYESYTLIHIAALLDRLNAPHNEEINTYFASLPPQISRDVQSDDTPF